MVANGKRDHGTRDENVSGVRCADIDCALLYSAVVLGTPQVRFVGSPYEV